MARRLPRRGAPVGKWTNFQTSDYQGSYNECRQDRPMPKDPTGRLFELLSETGAFQYSPDKPFRLASGATSPYYFDLRILNGDPAGISAVAEVFYGWIRQMTDIRSVGGLESGSISIATAVSQLSHLEHEKDPSNPLLSSFFVRKAPKAHGTQKLIEGKMASPAVIVEDVITSGASAIKGVRAAREGGCECHSLMAIIFRGTDEQRRNIESECNLQYVFEKDRFIERFQESRT